MAVPDSPTFMRAVLEVLAEQGGMRFGDLINAVADNIGLSEEDRDERLSSGQAVIRNRTAWAMTYLVQAGVANRPRHGLAEITDRGRELRAQGHDRITVKILEQYPEFVEFRARATRSEGEGPAVSVPAVVEGGAEADMTPVEQVENAARVAKAAVESELLSRIHAQPPAFLERLVLRLLVAMGYGERIAESSEHMGRTGDEGIDGVIRQDPLGLDMVYLQAKRYAPDVTVGRPDIQAFVGALHGAQAVRGVFITTSRFSSGAIEYAERVHNARIILIDGHRLAQLMLRYGIGVQPDLVVTLYRVDEDYFDTL